MCVNRDVDQSKEKKKKIKAPERVWGMRGGDVHVGIGLLPCGGGWVRTRTAGNGARSGELDYARVVPRGVGRGVQGVRAPVDEGERAAHVGNKELLGRRGVCADGAERVWEGDHVGGRLWARAAAAAGRAAAAGWCAGGRGGGRERVGAGMGAGA